MTQLNNFSGGLSKVISPNLISPNQGVIYENIDIKTGILSPSKEEVVTDIPYCRSMYYFKNKWITPLNCTEEFHYVEYNDTLYCNSMNGHIFKTEDGVNWEPLVITSSGVAPKVNGSSEYQIPISDSERYNRLFTTVRNILDETYVVENKAIVVYIRDWNHSSALVVPGFHSVKIEVFDYVTLALEYTGTFPSLSDSLARFTIPILPLTLNKLYEFRLTLIGKSSYYVRSEWRTVSNTYAVPEPTTDIKLDNIVVYDAGSGINYSFIDTTEVVIATEDFYSASGDRHMSTTYEAFNITTNTLDYFKTSYVDLLEHRIPVSLNPNCNYKFTATHNGVNSSKSQDFTRATSAIGSGASVPAVVPRGGLNATYTYVYTYFKSKSGDESAPSAVSDPVTVVNGSVDLYGILPSSTPGVDTIIIYRMGGALTSYAEVARIPNSQTSFVDTKSDLDIAGTTLTTIGTTADINVIYISETNGMLLGAWGNKLYYSDIAFVNRWRQLSFIEYSFEITGIATNPNGILVFGRNQTYIVTGTSPESFTNFLLSSSQGCISYNSIQNWNNITTFCSFDGICISSGGDIIVFTEPLIRDIASSSDIVSSAVFENEYYLFLHNMYYILNKTCLRAETSVKNITNSHYAKPIDRLLVGMNNEVNEIEKDFIVVSSDISASSFPARANRKSLRYKSPIYSESSLTLAKYWKSVVILCAGREEYKSTFGIIGDDNINFSVELYKGINEIKLPQTTLTKLFFIQFYIVGKLDIVEIRFSTGTPER